MLFTAMPRWSTLNMLPSRVRAEAAHQLFDQGIGITAVFSDFSRVAIKMFGIELLVQYAIEQSLAQHLNQPLAPVAYFLPQHEVLLLKILAVASDRLHQVENASSIGCNGLNDRRSPIVTADGQRLHGANFAFDAIGAFPVALVDHEHVRNFHNAGFDRLHIVSHSGHENYDGDLREAHDINFILTDSDSLDEDNVFPRCIEQRGNIRSRRSESSEKASSRHTADIDSRIGVMCQHANTIPKNRAARIGARRIDRNDPNCLFLLAILACELIDKCALTRSRRARKADYGRIAAVRKQRLHQLNCLHGVVFDRSN